MWPLCLMASVCIHFYHWKKRGSFAYLVSSTLKIMELFLSVVLIFWYGGWGDNSGLKRQDVYSINLIKYCKIDMKPWYLLLTNALWKFLSEIQPQGLARKSNRRIILIAPLVKMLCLFFSLHFFLLLEVWGVTWKVINALLCWEP